MKHLFTKMMLGHRGEMTITNDMEILDECFLYDKETTTWTKLAYDELVVMVY